jgi:hypothetical protein
MSQQPRTFRGRGGPTDGRLPKHHARRRKPSTPNSNAACSSSCDEEYPSLSSQEALGFVLEEVIIIDDGGLADSREPKQGDALNEDFSNQSHSDDAENAMRLEIQHLLRRIHSNHSSFSPLSTANSNPVTYQTNVLFATRNCVVEWRAIQRRYRLNEEGDIAAMAGMVRSTGQALFQLVQAALQSGPLAGAKPGYFKRCGSDVARITWLFLEEICPSCEDALALYFTENQAKVVEKWKTNLLKAMEIEKPPSPSVLKKRNKAIIGQQSKR